MGGNFGEEYQEIKNRALLELNTYFFNHIGEIEDSFRESLKAACDRVIRMQQMGYQAIEYLEFTLLRTRILEHDYRAPILVYGNDWYADTAQAQAGEIDMGSIFSFYEELSRAAEKLVKRYRMNLPEQTHTVNLCSCAESFWQYAAIALRRAVMGFTPGEMKITGEFRIRCCEYMGYGEVLRRHTPGMTGEQLKKWFDKREKDVYRFRDYRGFDFSGWDLSGMDLTGCDFRGCDFSGSTLEGADLTGAWFCGCPMREADLRGVWVPGARFDGADLTGATLEGAYCTCVISRNLWMRPDNVRPSFVNAALENADLTFSAMEEAGFAGASLRGAQFNDSHRDYYLLSGEQMAQAEFEESMDDGWDDDDWDDGDENGEEWESSGDGRP